MYYRAFKAYNKDGEYLIEQYPNLLRWKDNFVGEDNPIRDIAKWPSEIKYMTDGKISDDIKALPSDKGGIYMFYLKGINLPFSEFYILYR